MDFKRHLPNSITLLNVFCGSIAAVLASNSNFALAAIFVFMGIFFDFFDGLLARILQVKSELGIQLDSLADVITSGLVPGIIMFKLLSFTVDNGHMHDSDWNSMISWQGFEASLLPFLGFLITVGSAYRLARFNIDEDQQSYFIGLPTPANTLMIVSLPLILEFQHSDLINSIIINKWFLIAVTLLSTFLLNSNIKLFALKFEDWSFMKNATRYIFLLLSLVALIVLKFAAIPFIVILYIAMSLMGNVTAKVS